MYMIILLDLKINIFASAFFQLYPYFVFCELCFYAGSSLCDVPVLPILTAESGSGTAISVAMLRACHFFVQYVVVFSML